MGLREELDEIKEKLAEKELVEKPIKKPKLFKIPFSKRVKPKQASQNYVTVIKINENGFLDIQKERIVEQTIMVNGIPRLATPEYVLHWKKNPMLILPSWSVKPLSPSDEARESMNDGSNTKGYRILMARMKSDILGSKPQMGGMVKWIVGIVLAVIVGYALMTGGG